MALNWYIGLVTRPIHTIREIVDARPVGLGILTLLIVAVLNGLVSFGLGLDEETFVDFTDEALDFGLVFVIVGSIFFTAGVAVQVGFVSLIAHVIAKLLRGDGPYTGLLSGILMLSVLSLIPVVPGVLDALVSGGDAADDAPGAFAAIAGIVSLIVGIWSIILGIIVIRENYRLSAGSAVLTAIGTAILSVMAAIILFGLVIILFIVFAIAVGIATA